MEKTKLFFWRARTLYLGPALGLSPHRNAVAVLCAGVDGPFRVALNASARRPTYLSCRLALIPPNTLHHLLTDDRLMAFFYVDARSDDFRSLRAQAARYDGRLGLNLKGEAKYLSVLARLHAGAAWNEIREELADALNLPAPQPTDDRIDAALRQLRKAVDESTELHQLARQAGISPSHFLRLFKQATGVPFRRYRLWVRMGKAVRRLIEGRSLTEAALDAGFSSSAHFSAAYREMFGFAPSTLAKSAPVIVASASAAARTAQPSPPAPRDD